MYCRSSAMSDIRGFKIRAVERHFLCIGADAALFQNSGEANALPSSAADHALRIISRTISTALVKPVQLPPGRLSRFFVWIFP
jgi:hypothetical protein